MNWQSIVFICALGASGIAAAAAEHEVPGSRSPDGHWALYCTSLGDDGFSFSLGSVTTEKLRYSLVSSPSGDNSTDPDRMMFECAWTAIEALAKGESPGAEAYQVSWSPDSSLFAVSAGAHKFAHFCLYRRALEGVRELTIPNGTEECLEGYAKGEPHGKKVHAMGVHRFSKPDPIFRQTPDVFVMEDGYVALTTYWAQCNRSFQNLPEEQQSKVSEQQPPLYFLFHAGKKDRVKFIGLCQ